MIQNNPRTNDRCLDDAEVVYDTEFGDRRILGVKYNDHFVTAIKTVADTRGVKGPPIGHSRALDQNA